MNDALHHIEQNLRNNIRLAAWAERWRVTFGNYPSSYKTKVRENLQMSLPHGSHRLGEPCLAGCIGQLEHRVLRFPGVSDRTDN